VTQLWPWQQGAVDFATAPERERGGIFNMGMGTGKSLCVIETARRVFAKRVLIVGPKATVSENAWGSQFRQHGGGRFQPKLLNRGSSAKKSEAAAQNISVAQAMGRTAVNIINYESLWAKGFERTALQGKYDMIVYDECHKLKGPRARVSLFANKLSFAMRQRGGRALLLTGTLMPHSPLDIWAQMRALDPRVLGTSFVRFRARYAVMGGFENRKVIRFQRLDELQELIRPYVYRVGADVLQFDDPLVSYVHVDLPREAMKAYQQMERDLVAELQAGRVTAANGLVKLLRLQQFTSGYMKLDGDETTRPMHSAKEEALIDVLEGTAEEPVVVFGQFTGDQETARRAAEATGRDYFELSGRANDLEHWDAMSRASVTPAPVLGVQIQAGGTGINLTASGIAVYLSTGFNMGNLDQSKARINRPGRKPIVRFIFIEVENTIDTRVRHTLLGRKNLVEGVLENLTHQQA